MASFTLEEYVFYLRLKKGKRFVNPPEMFYTVDTNKRIFVYPRFQNVSYTLEDMSQNV